MKNYRSLFDFYIAFPLIISALFAVYCQYLSGGNVFNQYRFLSSDGLDWVAEGVYLMKSIQAREFLGELPVLRNTTYVVIATLDAFLGQKGFVFSLVSGLSLFMTFYYMVKFSGVEKAGPIVLVCGFVILALAPINHFRIFFSPDPLATGLSLASAWYVYQALGHIETVKKSKVIAVVLMVLGGLTQIYALIPPLIFFGVLSLNNLRNKKFMVVFTDGFFVVTGVVIFVILKALWLSMIPHETTPESFPLLRFSFDMIPFYAQVWGYYLLPFLSVIFVYGGKVLLKQNANNLLTLICMVVVLVYMLMLLLYQWKDARFTFYFWPFVTILSLRVILDYDVHKAKKNITLISLTGIVLVQSLLFSPKNFPAASFPDKKPFSIDNFFVIRFLNAPHLDRLSLKKQCGSEVIVCKMAEIPHGSTPYRIKIFELYKRLQIL